jgi:serine/threonine protein kinase
MRKGTLCHYRGFSVRVATSFNTKDVFDPSFCVPALHVSHTIFLCLKCRYRAPECLLTDGFYSYKMDMWGVGCVFFEIVALFPLFPGSNEIDQIQKIHNVLGTPSAELLAKFAKHSAQVDFSFPQKCGTGIAKLIPHCSPDCVDLIEKLLTYDPDQRISARQALKHVYFKEHRCSAMFAFLLHDLQCNALSARRNKMLSLHMGAT